MRRWAFIGWFTILLAFLAASAAADGPRATGFVAPSFVPNVRRVGSSAPTRASLLGATEPLPSRWDSREHGWTTPVKNQGGVGTCWSYASYAVLETQLLKAGRGEYEFSVKNMVNLHGFAMEPDDGGNYHMSGAYLLRWNGPVAETNDVYVMSTNNWTSSPVLPPILHVQHVVWTPEFGTSADATNELKAAIREAIARDERILPDPAPFVRLSEYKDSCIEYTVRVWCRGADYWDVYFDLNENVRECFSEKGVEMTYNHMNVHVLAK